MIRFLTILWNVVDREVSIFRDVFRDIVIATMVGALFILLFRPSVYVCFCLIPFPWLFSLYRLCSVRRFIRMYAIGETAKGVKITAEIIAAFVKKITRPETKTKAFDNEFIRAYLSIISGIFFVQTALFLMLPLYVNYTAGDVITGIIIVMVAVIIAISDIAFFTGMFRAAVAITVVVYVMGLTFVLFPQAGFFARGITEKINVIPVSTARIANEIKDLQAKQQEEIDNGYMRQVLEWQRVNPGKEPPQWFKDVLAKKRALM